MRYTDKNRDFFLRSAEQVAPQLLGAYLCKRDDKGDVLRFRIIETEAYCKDDTAAHSYIGEKTGNASMFMIGGTAYVFGCHGWQFDVVCEPEGIGECVLIRGIEGADGPVKLTRLLQITKENTDGIDLLDESSWLWLETGEGDTSYCVTRRRLGENKTADDTAVNRLWRFVLNSPNS